MSTTAKFTRPGDVAVPNKLEAAVVTLSAERPTLTREDLFEGIDRISGVIMANADDAERVRTLPLQCVEAMRREQLFAMAAPLAVGGLEVSPLTQMAIVEEVSRLDTSAGWTLMIGAHGAQVIGAFASDAAVAKVFGGPIWPISGSQISPFGGRFVKVDGGYRVTGRWTFASGIRHADWSMLTATDAAADLSAGPALQIAAALPVTEVTIHDNWHVAGLKGTGSCDYSLEDAFIREEMAWSFPPVVRRGGARYAIKTPQAMLACFALGAARRSMEEIVTQARVKMRPGNPGPVASRPSVHKALGEAEMALRSARAGLFGLMSEMWDLAQAGEKITEELEHRLTASPAYVYDVAREVTTTALRFGGSSALRSDNVLQRNFRDTAAGAQHMQASELNYETLGRWLAGVEQRSA